MVWICGIYGSLFVAGFSLIAASIREIHRAERRRALNARLEAIISPKPLSAKYLCLMSDEERRELETGRWD